MHRVLAVVLVASGCGFEVTGSGVRGDDAAGSGSDASSPDSQREPDGSPLVDTDGDGVLDATDNCRQVANANQRDHDADGIGDVCDPCPHLPKLPGTIEEADTDEDGVGDQCDPRPTTAGDSIKLFEGFYDVTAIALWSGTGTWSVSNGKLHQAQGGNGPFGIGPPFNVNRAFATTELTVVTVGGSTREGLSSVALDHRYDCSMSKESGSSFGVRVDNTWGMTGNAAGLALWSGTFAAASVVRLTMDLTTRNDCVATQGMVTVPINAAYGPTPGGRVFLGAQDAKVDYDYLFIVEEAP